MTAALLLGAGAWAMLASVLFATSWLDRLTTAPPPAVAPLVADGALDES